MLSPRLLPVSATLLFRLILLLRLLPVSATLLFRLILLLRLLPVSARLLFRLMLSPRLHVSVLLLLQRNQNYGVTVWSVIHYNYRYGSKRY